MVEKAIRCFAEQTYRSRELIIVASYPDASNVHRGLQLCHNYDVYKKTNMIYGEGVVVHPTPLGLSVGEMRNVACRLAHGSLLAHFDTDDWSAPDRIERSVKALEHADFTGTSLVRYYDPEKRLGWLWDGNLQAPTEGAKLGGCTLAYRRSAWEKLGGFDDLKVGEDTYFQRKAYERGFQFADLRDEMLFAGRVHEGNTSVKRPYPPVWTDIPYLEGVF
jgi:hypothetical protein